VRRLFEDGPLAENAPDCPEFPYFVDTALFKLAHYPELTWFAGYPYKGRNRRLDGALVSPRRLRLAEEIVTPAWPQRFDPYRGGLFLRFLDHVGAAR
jgi:hypothetical protein